MAALTSKRQQARNEKVLQDLVHSVPGNNFCADCQARNPAWASWSLGIFLCMRCAAIHRKLGTHISKVKSLSMDAWTNDQVDAMKKVGNVTSNKKFNPQNKRPPVPIDADEADSAMERFIRAKYVQSVTNGAAKKHGTGSTDSDEGTPPPLPPKTGRFGFKSNATFPLSFRSKKDVPRPPTSPHDHLEQGPPLRNKPSKTFGASVSSDSPEAMAQKLTQLRDMGFTDDKRNAMILKGVGGNIEKTIEALVRLGEGGGRSTPSLVSPRDSSLPVSRSHTPQPPSQGATLGLSQPSSAATRSPSTPSTNPWDNIPPAQPQSSQSTGTNPFLSMSSNASNNPFGMPSHQTEPNLTQSFQNMSLAPSHAQALFPHHTGGLPAPPPAMSQPMYQHSMTPPIPQTSSFETSGYGGTPVYQSSAQPQNYNPFIQTSNPQPPLSLNTTPSPFQPQPTGGGNPFLRSPTRIASPTPLGQIPEQSQQNVYNSPHSPYGSNPFYANGQSPQSAQPMSPAFFQPQQQMPPQQSQPQLQQPYMQQQTPFMQQPPQQARYDKANIMSLYGQTSPFTSSPVESQGQPNLAPVTNQAVPSPLNPATSPQRSASMPLPAASKNPFLTEGFTRPAPPPPPAPSASYMTGNNPAAPSSARSRESMTLGMEMAWNNGRHSPDAFASFSSRAG